MSTEKVIEMIESGTATKKGIRDELKIAKATLRTYFYFIRNTTGRCPIEDKRTKILSFVTKEELDQINAEKLAKKQASQKTFEEKREKAKLRYEKKRVHLAKLLEKADKKVDELLEMRIKEAEYSLQIAELLLRRIEGQDD